ncbi:arsinothricin resistance N-acetyltransferase ArsN1 family B [Haloarcula marina]|uniref:arsinothricin resistance N-acetyltransferase ArsN1 family B n=1 Tax=Haloarcula marina TaxID=2961574 RepID=UPI0020B78EBD|nr:arsinothricin resistance N-acetyltransferase ArsN1 family B [Halomicroarcula marina]
MDSTIRLATADDAGAIADIYAPVVEQTHISFETRPPTPEEIAQRIGKTVDRLPWLVCEYDDEITGYVYASPYREREAYQWAVEVSVYVHDSWRRHGIATALYDSLFALLELQGLRTAYAVIALPNPRSVAFHESHGFEKVGIYRDVGYKNGDWHDVGHWGRSLQSLSTAPSPPTPLPELRDSDAYAEALAAGRSSLRS